MIRSLTTMVVACLMFGCAAAQGHYVLDSSFHQDGYLQVSQLDEFRALATQPDGKVLVGTGMPGAIGIRRYHTDGRLDSTWGLNGFMNSLWIGLVEIFQIQARDSVVYYCGFGFQNNGPFTAYVAACDLSGAPITTFGSGGVTWFSSNPALREATDMVVNANHELYLVGNTTQSANAFLLKVTPNGQLDLNFDADGVTNLPVLPGHNLAYDPTLVLDANEQPVVRAEISEQFANSTQGKAMMVRFLTNGTPDSNFGIGGVALISHPSGANLSGGRTCVRSSGGYWISAESQITQDDWFPSVFALDAQGEPDVGFGDQGYLLLDSGLGMTYGMAFCLMHEIPGNRLLMLNHLADATTSHVALTAIGPSGVLDTTFGPDGIYLHDYGNLGGWSAISSAMDAGGRIFALGQIASGGFPSPYMLSCYKYVSTPVHVASPMRQHPIHPNPVLSGQWLHIGPGISHLSLIDVQGRVLHEWDAPDERIAVPDVPIGLYFLSGAGEEGSFHTRLVIR